MAGSATPSRYVKWLLGSEAMYPRYVVSLAANPRRNVDPALLPEGGEG